MGLILALDQGATKTAALVATAGGEILGVGYSRGACHASDGMDAAMAAVREAAAAALGQAGLGAEAGAVAHGPMPGAGPAPDVPAPGLPAHIDHVYAGMTGADWPHEYPLLETALREATGVANVTVVNDCIIARRAGTDAPWGAVLCAGTGLNAAVISPRGDSYIYGYYINGDDNGGTALGRLSLRAVFGAEAGIAPPTLLTAGLLNHFRLTTVDDLMMRYVGGELGPTSTLVPILVEAVRAGDAVAERIVGEFGERLARYVTAGLRRFAMTDLEQDVVLSGGIFKADLPGLRERVTQAIRRDVPGARAVDARYEPVVGALLLALEQRGEKGVSLETPAIAASAAQFKLIRMCS
ncbi:MAG TPA: BadF/BadG/BcrA/BcrD ATPase family protein [Symbiobacteriaceae bacterium]|nr:BadF/BadG/BcrA/BcrD ATPase family protein [Symbiobacteriaceae bacterium]